MKAKYVPLDLLGTHYPFEENLPSILLPPMPPSHWTVYFISVLTGTQEGTKLCVYAQNHLKFLLPQVSLYLLAVAQNLLVSLL